MSRNYNYQRCMVVERDGLESNSAIATMTAKHQVVDVVQSN